MQQDQMKADADRAWECLVPTCCTKALQRQKLQGAGWDNGPHSVTGRRSAGVVLLDSAFSLSPGRSNAKTGQPSALPCRLPLISRHGNVDEIIGKCDDTDQLRTAVNQLQSLLYVA